MAVDAGRLRYRVYIDAPNRSATADAAGKVDLTADANWSLVQEVWAEVDSGSKAGAEYFAANRVQAVRPVIVRIRDWSGVRGIGSDHRVRVKTGPMAERTLQVQTVALPTRAGDLIELFCTEAV